MAKKKTAANAAAAEETETTATTGTATATGTKKTTKEKPVVEVHQGLLVLLQKESAAAEQAASYLIQICELVERDHISNAAGIKTIMAARGTSEVSAKSQMSRIRSLLKDQDSLQALKDGNVTVRAAVKSAQSRRAATPSSKAKAFDAALNRFVEAAKALGQDKASILTTVEAALSKANIK
jgi:DNA-binding phage protein